jgi:hypothetical protein
MMTPRMNAWPAPHSREHSNVYRPAVGWNVTVATPPTALGKFEVDVGPKNVEAVHRVFTRQSDLQRCASLHANFGRIETETIRDDLDDLGFLRAWSG